MFFIFKQICPLTFWGECVLTTAFIINKIPASVLFLVVHHMKCFLRPKQITLSLRVFGCLCFGRNTNPLKHKFDPRTKPGFFLGIHMDKKGTTFMILLQRPSIHLEMQVFMKLHFRSEMPHYVLPPSLFFLYLFLTFPPHTHSTFLLIYPLLLNPHIHPLLTLHPLLPRHLHLILSHQLAQFATANHRITYRIINVLRPVMHLIQVNLLQ